MEAPLPRKLARLSLGTAATIMQPLVGSVLAGAAILKAMEQSSIAMTNSAPTSQRVIMIAIIETELILGFLAVAGICRNVVRAFIVVLLSAFVAIALSRTIGGARSCGCFGIVQVRPPVTLGFDLLAITGLCFLSAPDNHHAKRSAAVGVACQRGLLVIGAAIAIVIAVVLAVPPWRAELGPGLWVGPDDAAVCEPGAWIGIELPLLPFIDVHTKLRHGRWNVLLYHPKCSECKKPLEAHLARAGGKDWRRAAVQIVAGTDVAGTYVSPNVLHGILSGEFSWFLKTPLNVWLENGIVVRIREAEDQDAAAAKE